MEGVHSFPPRAGGECADPPLLVGCIWSGIGTSDKLLPHSLQNAPLCLIPSFAVFKALLGSAECSRVKHPGTALCRTRHPGAVSHLRWPLQIVRPPGGTSGRAALG